MLGMFIGSIIGLVIWGFISKLIADVLYGIAARKGYYENYHLWAWCFWVGLIGVLVSITIVVTLPEKENNHSIFDENHRGSKTDDSKESSILAEGLKEIGERAFASKSLKEIEVPEGIEIIGVYAFENCSNMKSILLPEGLKEIKKGAFDGCTSLKSIEIPASVEYIGQWAFYDCESLETITFKEVHEWYATKDENSEERIKTATFSSVKPSDLEKYCWHRSD